jgi:hypothetical protein
MKRTMAIIVALLCASCASTADQASEAREKREYRTGSNVAVRDHGKASGVKTVENLDSVPDLSRSQGIPHSVKPGN